MSRRYVKKTDLVTRDIAGETVIVPVKGKVGDLDSIYILNEVGTLMWGLIDGRTSVEQIVEAICRAYGVAPEEAGRDALDFFNALAEMGLIRETKAGDGMAE